MNDRSATSVPGPATGLKQNRNWRLLWFGSWGPEAVGGVLVAASVPALVLGPMVGVFVDRWDRRRTMMTADACCTVLIASLLLLPAVGAHLSAGTRLGIIYAVVAAASCFAQFLRAGADGDAQYGGRPGRQDQARRRNARCRAIQVPRLSCSPALP